jgi:hypothetical protein
VAVGIVYLSNTKIIFEGDVDGDGIVDSVQYALVDSAGNDPPTGSCPCSIKRSQVQKAVTPTSPLSQTPNWTQELQNVLLTDTGVTNCHICHSAATHGATEMLQTKRQTLNLFW